MKSLILSGILTGLLLPGLSVGQTTAEIAGPAAASPTPPTTWLPNTLFKLGTGLDRASGYGSYSGLLLPITFGVEHQFTPKISIYSNASPMLRPSFRNRPRDRPFVQLARITVDLGARYYYNQVHREQRGLAHGLFAGNYLALQISNDWYSYKLHGMIDEKRHYGYEASGVAALWGVQRHIGRWGLFDGNVGIGATNRNFKYTYNPNVGIVYTKRSIDLLLELNARISLAH